MDQTGSPKLLGLESDLSATAAQNTVVPRKRPGLMGIGSGTGSDRTVLRNLGLLLGFGFCFGSFLFFLSLLSSSFFLSLFLSFFLFLSRGLTCRIRPLAFSQRLDDAPHTPPSPH